MTYEQILQRAPLSTAAGDRNAAHVFVEFLSGVLRTDADTLSESQRRYLYRLRAKWQTRADGKDVRWNDFGSKPGPVMRETPKAESKSIAAKAWKRYERENEDPLLKTIMDKFGGPSDEFRHLLFPKKGGK